LSRARILTLFATLVALAAVLAACGGGSSDDPQTVIEDATLKGVKSGDLDLSLQVKSKGSEGGNFDLSVFGPFQSSGGEDLPQLDVEAKADGSVNGENIDFEGGLVLLSDRAFVNYEGTEYEVDPTTFGFVKSSLEQAQQQGSKENPGNVNACQEAAAGVEVGELVDDLENEGSVDVDGTATTKVSGNLNGAAVIDTITELTEDPACSAQLEAAGPLPLNELEKAKEEVSTALKKAHADVYVGDDHIIRKIDAELTISPKTTGDTLELDFELSIGGVNEEQEISAPSGAKPLEGLFQKLHINPLELLEGNGLGKLLENLGSGASAESEGSSSAEAPADESSQKAFLECLQKARTPVDLQNCASLKP
jgi:hypothetical protein